MQINFLGDSITAGAGAGVPEKMFSYLVCKHFNAQENNFGVCGTRISRQVRKTLNPDDEYFLTRAVQMPKNADFTFVMGGTNDFGHGDAIIGKKNDTDPYTFYGAFYELVKYFSDNFSLEKICFIIPLPRVDQDCRLGDGSKEMEGGTLAEYIQIEKEILNEFHIEYLDLSDIFPVPTSSTGDKYTVDGLHPNPKGYELIANKLIDYLNKKLKIERK